MESGWMGAVTSITENITDSALLDWDVHFEVAVACRLLKVFC